jgi:hypothetical protein
VSLKVLVMVDSMVNKIRLWQFGGVMASIFCALPSFAAADEAAAQVTAACNPQDQLACACKDAGYTYTDPQWKACFLGDVNYTTVTQVDVLSSRAFTALNWPVATKTNGAGVVTGTADYAAKLAGDWTPVWASWKSTSQIFGLPDGPVAWDSSKQVLPATCDQVDVGADKAKISFADQISDALPPRLLNNYINPDGHALLDSTGVPVRYDVAFNQVAYTYVTDNDLWARDGLDAFLKANGKLDLPAGQWDKGPSDPATRGAIVIKTSWKVLTNDDDPSLFHKQWAYITPVIENGSKTVACQVQPVGLVGMHLTYKTKTMPEWGWATFEHSDVAPLWSQIGETTQGISNSGGAMPNWLFYSKNTTGAAGLNVAPKNSKANVPSRIVRDYPAGYYFGPVGSGGFNAPCDASNQNFHCINETRNAIFADSVFANYILIGTQWRDSNGTYGHDLLVPEILGNATMETFTQTKSSCTTCHNDAAPKGDAMTGVFDFLFSFEQATENRSN